MTDLKIKLIAYNVGDKGADEVKPDEMFRFLKEDRFDFVFIGLQEVVNDPTWTAVIKKYFGSHDFVIFKVRNIWAMWLYGLVKRTQLPWIDNVESEVTASGYANVLGNKGGLSIRFKFRSVSIAVVNAHLTAHEEGFKERLDDYLDIVQNQSFRDPGATDLLDHNFLFWMGDLNFRIENLSKADIEKNIKLKNYSPLIENDQLVRAMREQMIFNDFKEGSLGFPPTFKFDDDSDVYDTSKKARKPAWTDRILYLCGKDSHAAGHRINVLKYDCERALRGSDHRPVFADFQVHLQQPEETSLPIVFDDVHGAWNREHDEKVSYRCVLQQVPDKDDDDDKDLMSFFKPDRRDWIALVPAHWSLLSEDQITYFYVSTTCMHDLQKGASVDFSKKYLSSIPPNTALQVVYFSKRKNCIQGYSKVFHSKP